MTHPLIQSLLDHVRQTAAAFVPSESGAATLRFFPATGHAGTITVTVLADPLNTAPHLRRFSVRGWTGFDTPGPTRVRDERLHEIDYLWERSGSPGNYTLPTRIPVALRNKKVAYGADVAWVFEPGEHTVSCLVIERSSGKTAYWEQTFTVATRAATFPTSQTLYVSNTSDFSAAPSGAVTYTSLATAFNAAKNTSTPRCIMLRDGETHTIPISPNLDLNANWWNFYMCRDGSGSTRPTIQTTDGGTIFDRMDRMSRMQGQGTPLSFIMDGLRMVGPYDSATQTGITASTYAIQCLQDNNVSTDGAPEYSLIHNCFFSGFEMPVIATAAKPTMKQFCFSECEAESSADYKLAYGQLGDEVYLLGCRLVEKANAIWGGPRNARHNNHGVIRLETVKTWIADATDFCSIGGWIQNTTNVYTAQANVRLWTEAQLVTGAERASFRRCVIENGFETILLQDKDGQNGPKNLNAIIAHNYFIGSHMTAQVITTQFGGTTVENNTIIIPNTPNLNGAFVFGRVVAITGIGLTAPTQLDKIVVRHNTIISYKTTTSNVLFTEQTVGTTQTDILVEHNLTHFPNGSPVSTPFAPLSIANAITPHIDGWRHQHERFTTSIGSIAPSGFVDINYSTGSYGDGTQTSYLAEGSFLAAPSSVPFTLTFNASSVRVTNPGPSTWSAGTLDLRLKRAGSALPPNQTAYATPATGIGPATPLTGSAAIGGAGTTYPRFDILGGNRKTIIDPLARTAATDGAVEVARES